MRDQLCACQCQWYRYFDGDRILQNNLRPFLFTLVHGSAVKCRCSETKLQMLEGFGFNISIWYSVSFLQGSYKV